MNKKTAGFLKQLAFAFIFLISWTACSDAQSENAPPAESPVIYRTFAEIEPLFNMDNDTTYVINFWATWCKPCVQELPFFTELYNTYRKEKVKLVLVSLDFENQIDKKLIPFIEKNKLEPEVVVLLDPDANNWIPKIAEEWSGSIPATLVYKNGRRVFFEQSFDTFEELNAIIKPFL